MCRFICGVVALVLVLACTSAVQAQSAQRSALAALGTRLPEVKFEGTRFADAVDYLREVSGANFSVDWKRLETVGVTRDTPITFSARRITLRKALSLMLSQTSNPGDLAYYNDGGVIEITTKAVSDEVLITRVYDIEDLLVLPMSMNGNTSGTGTSGSGYSSGSSGGSSRGRSDSGSMMSGSSRTYGGGGSGGSAYGGRSSSRTGTSGIGTGTGSGYGGDKAALADELVVLIMDTIEPDIWRENGGTSSIRYFRGNLIISAPRRIHERIGGPFE